MISLWCPGGSKPTSTPNLKLLWWQWRARGNGFFLDVVKRFGALHHFARLPSAAALRVCFRVVSCGFSWIFLLWPHRKPSPSWIFFLSLYVTFAKRAQGHREFPQGLPAAPAGPSGSSPCQTVALRRTHPLSLSLPPQEWVIQRAGRGRGLNWGAHQSTVEKVSVLVDQ